MIRRAEVFAVRWGWLVLGAWVAAGCSPLSHPTAGDTNTSWLRSCASDADCGPGNCLGHVCSLACDPGASRDVCGRLSATASCEAYRPAPPSGRCDVLCQDDRDCTTLGSGYTCQAGACRDARADVGADTGPQDAKDAATPDSTTPVQPPATPLSSPADAGTLLEPKIDADWMLGPPRNTALHAISSAWQGDHWLVAYQLLPETAEGSYYLMTARIDRNGTTSAVTKYALARPLDTVALALRVGRDDMVAELFGPARSARAVVLGSGEARFYKHAQMLFTKLPFDSAETIWSLAPTRGDDWLIGSYHMLDSSAVAASVGRYNPLRMLWSSMLQVVAPDSSWGGGDLWLGTRGNDGVLFYVGMGGVRTGRMLPGAAAGQQASLVSGEAQPLDGSTLSALSNPELDDGLRWQVSDGSAGVKTWSGVALDAPTGQAPQFQFTLGPLYPFETHYAEVQDMEPSADATLLAVCHADNRINAGPPLDRLYLSVFSAAGAVRLGPLLLDEADIGMSSCRVSASNDAFLVTWRKTTSTDTSLDPRARIVPFPN